MTSTVTFDKEDDEVLAVPRIHEKIALNVVKAWKLVQMKLLSSRSLTERGKNTGGPLKG